MILRVIRACPLSPGRPMSRTESQPQKRFTILAKTFFRSISGLQQKHIARLSEFVAGLHDGIDRHHLDQLRSDRSGTMSEFRLSYSPNLSAVIHETPERITLLHCGASDAAREWGRTHRFEEHPVTRRPQIVGPPPGRLPSADSATNGSPLEFTKRGDQFLLSLGIPEDWVDTVKRIRNEDDFRSIAGKLPEDVAEYLYSLILGELVEPPKPAPAKTRSELTPNARRELYVLQGHEELAAVLSRPFEEWAVFLHPDQRVMVENEYNGPCKVTGPAGTGKTVVALHRARWLAEQGKTVLLTTYTKTLAGSLDRKLRHLVSGDARKLIQVRPIHDQAAETLHAKSERFSAWPSMSNSSTEVNNLLQESRSKKLRIDQKLISHEWQHLVMPSARLTFDEYEEMKEAGIGIDFTPKDRVAAWSVFEKAWKTLQERGDFPPALICRRAREAIAAGAASSPFDAVVVDEVQDLNVQEILFAASLTRHLSTVNLMLVGDAGQRIYPGGFSLRRIGIETRSRSKLLTVNYRTTLETARAAAPIRSAKVDDLEEGVEGGADALSLMRGDKPMLASFSTYDRERAAVVRKIQTLIATGCHSSEIAVFARKHNLLSRIRTDLGKAGISTQSPSSNSTIAASGGVVLGTLHSAKGLEFRFVFVIACRDAQLPLQTVRAFVPDEAKCDYDRQEKSLLYVAMTRARERVWITWTTQDGQKPSRFLKDVEPFAERFVGS